MEEPCDWAVCAEAAAPGPLAPPSSRTERKRKKKEEKRSEASVENQRERVGSRPAPAAGDGCDAAVSPAGGAPLQPTPTRRELQEALPKIPPLSSFKSCRVELVGLDQAEQLFHRFITAGSGRSVEVVREFRGHDDSGQGEEQGEEGRRETITLPDDSPLALKTPGKWSHFLPSPTPTSPMATPTAPRPTPTSPTATPTAPRPTTEQRDNGELRAGGEKLAPPAVRGETERTSTSSVQERLPQGAALAYWTPSSPSANQKAAGKQSNRKREVQERGRTGGHPVRERRGGAWRQRVRDEEKEEEQQEQEEGREGREREEEAFWRSSYRAWRDRYSSFSPPAGQSGYYSCYTAAHHWMAAYRMNLVYMEELLKN